MRATIACMEQLEYALNEHQISQNEERQERFAPKQKIFIQLFDNFTLDLCQPKGQINMKLITV